MFNHHHHRECQCSTPSPPPSPPSQSSSSLSPPSPSTSPSSSSSSPQVAVQLATSTIIISGATGDALNIKLHHLAGFHPEGAPEQPSGKTHFKGGREPLLKREPHTWCTFHINCVPYICKYIMYVVGMYHVCIIYILVNSLQACSAL